MSERSPQSNPPAGNPMKSFRGVMAGSLIMEGIAVALALPVVANLGGGIGSTTAWAVIGIATGLIVLCGLLKRSWAVAVALTLQVALIAFFFAVPAVAMVGLVFLAFWLWILWLRRDVARRMAEGTLPTQQEPRDVR